MFLPNRVRVGNQEIPFRALVWQAYMGRVSLSSTGFYKTPKIHWDRASGTGRPFYYFAYGAACSEVMIDTLTGEYRVERVDILHDCGKSLNPALDIGQIEGGFVQGMGWLTTEELWWDEAGPAAHPRAQHLQDPRLRRPPAHLQRPPVREREPRGRDLPLQGGGRAAADAGHLGPARASPTPSPASPATASARASTAPATPERVLDAVERLRREAGPAERAA